MSLKPKAMDKSDGLLASIVALLALGGSPAAKTGDRARADDVNSTRHSYRTATEPAARSRRARRGSKLWRRQMSGILIEK